MSSHRYPPPSSSSSDGYPHLLSHNPNPLRSSPPGHSLVADLHSQNWGYGGTGAHSRSRRSWYPYQYPLNPLHPNYYFPTPPPLLNNAQMHSSPQLPPRAPNYLPLPNGPRLWDQLVQPIDQPNTFCPPPPPPPSKHVPTYCLPPQPPRPTLPHSQRLAIPAVHNKEENHIPHLSERENKVVRNTKDVISRGKRAGSTSGTKISDQRALNCENLLNRETRFVGRMKFWNDLTDPTDQPKVVKSSSKSYDRFTKYKNSSLEQQQRPELYVEPDLGIPLDVLDHSVLNPPKGVRPCFDPEDEELMWDEDVGLKKKERPDANSFPWLLNSEHRSSRKTKGLKEKQMEREGTPEKVNRDGDQFFDATLESSPTGESQIDRYIENTSVGDAHEYFHGSLLARDDDQFVDATFQSSPTSQIHKRSSENSSVQNAHESDQSHSGVSNDASPSMPPPVANTDLEGAVVKDSGAHVISNNASPSKHQPVDNSHGQGAVVENSDLNHSGGVEHNRTRPKRVIKKPAYLADFEL